MQEAEKKKNEPVDESQVIDDVFGFIENEDEKEVKREPSLLTERRQSKEPSRPAKKSIAPKAVNAKAGEGESMAPSLLAEMCLILLQ